MIGTRLAHYEITSHLGSGGMGDVYQATDSKLGRSVAIKLLPEAFSHDNERSARFEREARVLASLNHPRIAAIYGLEESGGWKFLVMELVGGKTLAERIKRGPIPLDEALGMAKQIAEALEAAHEKGIIHRDLKPGNVMITPSGEVKVLDFGLAKVRQTEVDGASLSDSPTMITAAGPGMILGTAAYMSPEQAKGNDADRTADVWAFGCVLYEMLTGRAVFQGETVGEILAGVLKTEPDWRRLPAETPEGIRRLLRRCLQKNPKLRFRDSGDVRIEIEEVQNGSGRDTPGAPRFRAPMAWAALMLVALFFGAAIVWIWRPAPSVAAAPEMRLDIVTPLTKNPASLAISPDGQKIVFAAIAEGRSGLWLRSLDSVSARPLTGTDGGESPFWSPDSRSIGFFADGKLNRIEIDGGSIQTIASSAVGRGGTWNRDGVILFNHDAVGAIFRIDQKGGASVPVTRFEPHQQAHQFPQFLPDGRHFIYRAEGTPEVRGVYLATLDGTETRRLLDAGSKAVYAASGQLLFVQQGTLFAQNFDPVHLALTGNPFSVAEQVASTLVGSALSVSAAGPIAYRTGSAVPHRQFVWFDRSGNEIKKIGNSDSGRPVNPAISPDGRSIALNRIQDNNNDIWLLEPERGVLQRFTSDPAIESNPIWSPDGNRIVFNSSRKGGPDALDLYQHPANGAPGNDQLLLTSSQAKLATDWSPDGRFVLYQSVDPKTHNDIWVLPLDGNGKPGTPTPVIQTNFDERDGQFSPDGKWIAYESDESGHFDIYVKPFPGPGAKSQLISTNGGAQPRWGRDGKELFYIAMDGQLMAVPIRLAADTQTVRPESPVALFTARVDRVLPVPGTRQQYLVSKDGKQFLMNTVAEEATSPITVILNWKARP